MNKGTCPIIYHATAEGVAECLAQVWPHEASPQHASALQATPSPCHGLLGRITITIPPAYDIVARISPLSIYGFTSHDKSSAFDQSIPAGKSGGAYVPAYCCRPLS